MDDDALRRGQPTCHVKFGEDVAILAGDGLYAEAFRHLLDDRRSPPSACSWRPLKLAAATGVSGMVGGQYVDVEPGARRAAALRRLHELKTGRLIGASVIGALLLAGTADGPGQLELPPLCRRAGCAVPDRRRHPRRDGHRRRARQAAGQR